MIYSDLQLLAIPRSPTHSAEIIYGRSLLYKSLPLSMTCPPRTDERLHPSPLQSIDVDPAADAATAAATDADDDSPDVSIEHEGAGGSTEC